MLRLRRERQRSAENDSAARSKNAKRLTLHVLNRSLRSLFREASRPWTTADPIVDAFQWLVVIKNARSLDWGKFKKWLDEPKHVDDYKTVERQFDALEETILMSVPKKILQKGTESLIDVIATNLRRMRRSRRMSIEELARACHYTPDFVRSVERAELPDLSLGEVDGFAGGLGVHISELLRSDRDKAKERR